MVGTGEKNMYCAFIIAWPVCSSNFIEHYTQNSRSSGLFFSRCFYLSRALLLMAAQGKSSREETFDVATARNGFSGIQACDLADETKVRR